MKRPGGKHRDGECSRCHDEMATMMGDRDEVLKLLDGADAEDLRNTLLELVEKGVATVTELAAALNTSQSQSRPPRPKKAKITPGGSGSANDETVSQGKPQAPKERGSRGKKRPMDFSKYRTRHIALQVMYEGGSYHGFADQGNDSDVVNTVEKELFAALMRARLIQGVSALCQVVALQVRSKYLSTYEGLLPASPYGSVEVAGRPVTEYNYCNILNQLLPPAIRTLAWVPVTEKFSARFSCESRTYRYFFHKKGRDLSRMRQAAQAFVGDHDFRNFAKMDAANVSNFRRVIKFVRVEEMGSSSDDYTQMCVFEVSGYAFLYHMVRCMVSVLFMVGEGKEEASVINEMLDINKVPGRPLYKLAPDLPLVLHNCGYRSLDFSYSPAVLWRLQGHVGDMWEEATLKAARLQNALEYFGTALVKRKIVKAELLGSANKAQRAALNAMDLPDWESEEEITWSQAVLLLKALGLTPEGAGASGSKNQSCGLAPWKKLLERPREKTYEERVVTMKGCKKERFDKNQSYKEGKQEGEAMSAAEWEAHCCALRDQGNVM